MNYETKLDTIEQGIDNLSELLGISQTELVTIIEKGFYGRQSLGVSDKHKNLLDELQNTFREL